MLTYARHLAAALNVGRALSSELTVRGRYRGVRAAARLRTHAASRN